MPSIQLPHDPQRRINLNLLSSSRFDLPTVHAMMTEQFTNASLFDTFIFNGQEFIKGHQWAFSLSQLSQSGIIIDRDTLNTQNPNIEFEVQQILLSWSIAERERYSAKNELEEIKAKETAYQNEIHELKQRLSLEQNKNLTTGQNSYVTLKTLKSMKVILPVTLTTLEIASHQLNRPKLSPLYWVKTAATKLGKVFHSNSSGASSFKTIDNQLPIQKKPLFEVSTAPSYVGIQSVPATPTLPTLHLGSYIWLSL